MLKTLARAVSGLLAVALVAVQVVGCHTDIPSSLPPTSENLQPPTSPSPSTDQTVVTYVPPDTSRSTTLPSLTPPTPFTTADNTEPPTAPPSSATETPPPLLPFIEPPEDAKKLVIGDSQGDFFDGQGQSIQAEACLDIVGAEAYLYESGTFFRMMLGGTIPSATSDPDLLMEWVFFIDADLDNTTGWAGEFVANDIGIDYFLRLVVNHEWIGAEIYDTNTLEYSALAYQLADDTVSLYVPASVLALEQFNFTAATRKWQSGGLAAADKAPDQGYYNMPEGHIYIKSGPPTLQFVTDHATVWYNEGNEERARWYAEAFEAAYVGVDQILKPPPQSRVTVFVYAFREDMVAGLQAYSGLSADEASQYKDKGAPRPANYLFHIPPDFEWRDVYHQQVLGTLDRLC